MADGSSPTWDAAHRGPALHLTAADRVRIVARGLPMVVLMAAGLALALVTRLVERPLCGTRRPVSRWIPVVVSRIALTILGLRRHATGRPMAGPGAMLANHASWLDILVLNASAPVRFVAKSDVARWPGIGALARAAGTLFVSRDRRDVARGATTVRNHLGAGQPLVLFPEGTSTDGRRVLPFRAPLLSAVMAQDLRVQPVSVVYAAPNGADPRFYGWWGAMPLAPHLAAVLAVRRQGRVTVVWHPPAVATDFADRKRLAAAMEALVRDGLLQAGVRPA